MTHPLMHSYVSGSKEPSMYERHSPVGKDRQNSTIFSITGAKQWGAWRRRPSPGARRSFLMQVLFPDYRNTSRREEQGGHSRQRTWLGQDREVRKSSR